MAVTVKTRKKLWAKAGNRCAMCRCELVTMSDRQQREIIVGEECHIASSKKNGPRHDPECPTEKFDEYDNLILLCSAHHKEIDDAPDFYYDDYVRGIKQSHERWVSASLAFIDRSEFRHENRLVEFAGVEIASSKCQWDETDLHYSEKLESRYHQLAVFRWSLKEIEQDRRVPDPVFDVNIVNHSNDPLIVTAVGFLPISYRNGLKGLPVPFKVETLDSITLDVKHLKPGVAQMKQLEQHVYMQPQSSYRYDLYLQDFVRSTPGNEAVIRLLARISSGLYHSGLISLGWFPPEE